MVILRSDGFDTHRYAVISYPLIFNKFVLPDSSYPMKNLDFFPPKAHETAVTELLESAGQPRLKDKKQCPESLLVVKEDSEQTKTSGDVIYDRFKARLLIVKRAITHKLH